MLNIEQFAEEVKKIAPDSEPLKVGSFSGFKHVKATALHTFVYIDLFVEGLGFIHVVSRNSFDEDLLTCLVREFERNRIKNYKKNVLRMHVGQGLKHFDCYGLAPPLLAKAYSHESELLTKHGYQLFPMHGIEFLDGFSEDQFWSQRLRKDQWAVNVLRWDRSIEITGYGRSNT